MAVVETQRETEFILRIYILDYPMKPDQLTRLLGVVPTFAHMKGAFRIPGHTFKRNSWTKYAISRGSLMMSAHVVRFLDTIRPLPERLKQLVGKCEVAISCHINDCGKGYVIYCDEALVRRLAEMSASLEVIVHDGVNDPEPTDKDAIDLGFLPDED